MPVAFNFKSRRVRLLDLRGVDCREYWFSETVQRWRDEHPEAGQVEIDLKTFEALARRDPGRAPAGFIYHVNRCGSTLLSNMLAVPDHHMVLKESETVFAVLRRLLEAQDEAQRREAEQLLAVTLPFMARSEPGSERRTFFKLAPWSTPLCETLSRLFPSTPAVFLYRDARAVVAHHLAIPSYDTLFAQPRSVQVQFFPSLRTAPRDLSRVARYAHVWRSSVEAALAVPRGRLYFVDYDELVTHPRPTLARLLAHLGVSSDAAMVDAMCAVQRTYSKDPEGRAEFDPAGAHLRPALDAAQEAEVATVIGDLPQRLVERRRASYNGQSEDVATRRRV